MEIILMRHGKPCFTDTRKVAAHEMLTWLYHYDLSDICDNQPPEACQVIGCRAQIIVSSHLSRAISSVAALHLEPKIVDDIFREVELPIYLIPILRLSPFGWIILFRLMWFCGMSKEVESLSMVKNRARRAADMLFNLAKEHGGSVLLMGHGIMNRFIAKELTLLGWKEHTRAEKGYWSAGIFQLS